MDEPRALIIHPVFVKIENSNLRRESIRPRKFRDEEFAELHDDTTLFYDVFFSRYGDKAVLLGPPFHNLTSMVEKAIIVAHPSRQKCEAKAKHLDRHAQLWVSIPRGTEQLSFMSQLSEFEMMPQHNLSAFFAGKRVLVTLSKNNRLEWIQDWARYHRDLHGANAILIYDNASTEYSETQLASSLAELIGIERVCVVSWPFKYGPQGQRNGTEHWDSDYCQPGALEDARWRFLQDAASVMNSDVDELVISASRQSVFEAAERSWTGLMRYYGGWVTGIEDRTRSATEAAPIRHRDFEYSIKATPKRKLLGLLPDYANRCPPKWTVVPRRCPPNAQWLQHYVDNWRGRGWPALLTVTQRFDYCHFLEISTHWKEDRFVRSTFNSNHHFHNTELRSLLATVNWES